MVRWAREGRWGEGGVERAWAQAQARCTVFGCRLLWGVGRRFGDRATGPAAASRADVVLGCGITRAVAVRYRSVMDIVVCLFFSFLFPFFYFVSLCLLLLSFA